MSDARPASRRRKFSVEALFQDTSPRAAGVSDLVEAKLIQLERIEPDPQQPRKEFDEEALDELAASIRIDGVLQPIAVRYDAERDVYVILHGERRWRAASKAGLGAIPAVVREVPEDRRLIQQLVENVVREDLNALDRAAALRALKARMNDAPWERVAEAVGIRRSRLFQLLGTEKLDDTLKEALRRGIVSEKQTRAAGSLPGEAQREIGSQLLDGSLDPRAVDGVAQRMRAGGETRVPVATVTAGSARKHARGLQRALDQLAVDLDDLDPDTATTLHDDLDALRDRIDELLPRLR